MMRLKIIGLIVMVMLLLAACGVEKKEAPAEFPSPDLSTGKHYADTAWATVHRDSRNSDYSPFVASENLRVKWEVLDGAAIAIGPTFGPEGNIYITTGQGLGKSHLHVFDRDGNLRWKSAPQQTLDDLDYAAFMNAAVVDSEGDVYVGDLNQLWAFHPDGSIKWVASVFDQGATGFIVTPIFSKQGYVGGITTDGKVIFFNRESGTLVWSVLDLPGKAGPKGKPAPEGFMGGGLLEPSFIQPLWDLIWGWEIEVANTPAVHPETGRIYITAAGSSPNTGVLYGIDTNSDGLSIAFSAPMGAGSGTSPTLSHDGRVVCAADEAGIMYGIDGGSGKVLWKATGALAGASPAVGPDGIVYSYSEGNIVAINAEDGSIKWKANYDILASEHLRESKLADRIARVDTIITVSPGKVWAAIDLDYGYMIGDQLAPMPQMTMVTAIDPTDGRVISTTPVRDTCGAFITPSPDGTVYVSLGAFASSAQYFILNKALPEEIRVPGPLKAGLIALEPAFAVGHTRQAIQSVLDLADEALRNFSEGRPAIAITSLERGRAQLRGSQVSLDDAIVRGEIDRTPAEDCLGDLNHAEGCLYNAVLLLREGKTDISEKLQQAKDLLEKVISKLRGVPMPAKKLPVEQTRTDDSLPTPDPTEKTTSEPLPEYQGPKWVFRVSYGDTETVRTSGVKGEETVGGVDTYVIQTIYDGTVKRKAYSIQMGRYAELELNGETLWRSKNSLEPVKKESNTKALGLFNVTTTFEYAYDGACGVPLEKDKSWSFKQEVIPSMGNRTTKEWTAKVVGIEDVTVPAGTFSCYRVEHKMKDDTRTEWWSTANDFITPVKVEDRAPVMSWPRIMSLYPILNDCLRPVRNFVLNLTALSGQLFMILD